MAQDEAKPAPPSAQKTAAGLISPPVKFTAQQIEDSRMLDSTGMEAEHGVNKLTHRSDGTTVVRYNFSENVEEANRLCMNNAEVQFACTVSTDEHARKLVRDTMKSIVDESGAKIVFEPVAPTENADITFVSPKEPVKLPDGDVIIAYAGSAGGKQFIVYDTQTLTLDAFRKSMEDRMKQYTPEQKELANKNIQQKFGSFENMVAAEYEQTQKRLLMRQ